MHSPKRQAVQKYHKSGTPITTTPNPRAGIIKGPTSRRRPDDTSPKPRPPSSYISSHQSGPCPCNFGQPHPPGFDINVERRKAEAAYGIAMTANPYNIGRIEEYLASQYQKVLSVTKMGGNAPAFSAVTPNTLYGRAKTAEDTIALAHKKKIDAMEDQSKQPMSPDSPLDTPSELDPENEDLEGDLQNPPNISPLEGIPNAPNEELGEVEIGFDKSTSANGPADDLPPENPTPEE